MDRSRAGSLRTRAVVDCKDPHGLLHMLTNWRENTGAELNEVSAAVLEPCFQRDMIPHEPQAQLFCGRHVFCCFRLRSASIRP
ncbi:hypothetical protein SRHO_G00314270 [Serrasalmus rhombeus]